MMRHYNVEKEESKRLTMGCYNVDESVSDRQ
jgi:hypothetical protein